LIGASYGLLVGVLVFLVTRIGLEPQQSSSLIMLDPVGLAWIGTVLSALITGICGVLVGLIVGLWRINKSKAAAIGTGIGLVVVALISLDTLSAPPSLSELVSLLGVVAILPVGLALMALLVAVVSARLK